MSKSTPLVESAEPKDNNRKLKGGLVELGDSGTQMYAGIVYEEYNSKLRDREGIEKYDEMRKSDGTVKSALLACSLPIIRAEWYVKPASDDQKDIDIADFVKNALFEMRMLTWESFIRQALLALPFGVMVFEKVFATRVIEGQTYIVWDRFAPRLPRSIQAWQTQDNQPGVQQAKQDGTIANIPMEKLLVFVNEKEGDNWWGTSVLRAAYKHWHMKNTFYKIDAIAFERQGLGIPFVKLPQNASESDRSKAENILKNIRANDQAFLIEPFDYEIGFKDMMAKTTRDASPAIQHHNREIVKSVLAQFLELGATDSGSRALSTDQTDLFLLSLEAIANMICDVVNKDAIKEIVDLNFDGVSHYPKLDFADISRVDVQEISSAYGSLVTAGAIVPSDDDEQYLRGMLGLPERDMSEDEEDSRGGNKKDDIDVLDELEMSEFKESIKKKVFPERAEIKASISATLQTLEERDHIPFVKHMLGHLQEIPSTHYAAPVFSIVRSELSATLADLRKKTFEEGNDFKSFRALTFAEKKVDFNSIEKNLDKLEASFDAKTRALLHGEREKFMSALTKAVQAGDKEAIKKATIKAQAAYSSIIKQAMKESYEFGKNNAAREISVTAPSNARAVLDQIDIQANALADMHIAEITNTGKTALVESLNKGNSTTKSLAVADAIVAAKIDELVSNTSTIAMAGYVNTGRNTVFDSYSDKIYALQRSELLDGRTCNYCLSIDGRVVEKGDPFARNTIFHSGCRGIWVSILLDEQELPSIGGIPKTLRNRFGDAVNDLIQPKVPQTKKESLARKEQERRLKRQAKRNQK